MKEIVRVLEDFRFEEAKGSTVMRKEPIGVCGLITPWNWPMNQIATKVAPAPMLAFMPAVGDAAAEFTLPDQEERPVRLSDLRGSWVVLWWYPKASTGG